MSADRAASGASSLVALLGAALVPKCPLCVAAWLGALGLGSAMSAEVAPLVRPAVFVLAALTVLVAAATLLRHRRRPARCCATARAQ